MRSADYTRLAQHLPAVYQDDAVSFAQVDAYLGLVDELNHAYLERLEDLAMTIGPDASLRWPTDLPLDAGKDALLDAYLAAYDEAAAWASFTFPRSWPSEGPGAVKESAVAKRRAFVARSARLWRRRGTPRGFLDWFCFAFDVAPTARPYLLEHFKVDAPEPELTGTLFVPSSEQFTDYRRRHEAVEFVQWYSPAHVLLRVCWTRPDFVVPVQGTLDLATYRADLRALLCSVTSFIDHANGIHLCKRAEELRSVDRLDVGHLPSKD